MNKTKAKHLAGADSRQLVRSLLGLQPESLAAMDTIHGSVAWGLNVLLRLTLQHAADTLSVEGGTIIRLRSEASATASGWGSARQHALSSLFVWALIQEPRRARGLPFVPLCAADPSIADLSPKPDVGKLWLAAEASAVAETLFGRNSSEMRDAPSLSALQSMPICPLVENLLGIEPLTIVRAWYDTSREAEENFARDPEGQVAAALAKWFVSILALHRRVLDEKVDDIMLLVVSDATYEGPANAAYSNVGALLLAGLLAEGYDRKIAFLVHKAA